MFSIKESVRTGWELFKHNKKIILSAVLVLAAVAIVSKSLENEPGVFVTILSILVTIIGIVVQIGWNKILLAVIDRREHIEIGELFRHWKLFFRFLFSSILVGLLVLVGVVLLIIPGIYFAITYSFVPILAIDTNLSYKELFRESARRTKGVKWKLIGLFIVMALINLLGLVALVVGLLVTIPVTQLAYLLVYRKLSRKEEAVEVVVEPVPAVSA